MVGWYSTGQRLREADIDITDLLSNYCDTPLLVICEVQVRVHAALDIQMPQSCIVPVISHCAPISWLKTLIFCLQPKAMGLPTTAYYATDEIREVLLPAEPPTDLHMLASPLCT